VACVAEAPDLDALAAKWGSVVRFVGVDTADARSDAISFARHHGMRYALVHEAGDSIKSAYGVSALPETFVLDPRGRAIAHFAGVISGDAGDVTAFEQALRRAGARLS
jgi:cytochrome c biogenesis protein CcmG/thiol:disulfide interchange protein DsbE